MALTREQVALINNLKKGYLLKRAVESREKCETSLSHFIKTAWPLVEPGVKYLHNWHIDCISEHLEAVNSGQIKRLIINIPPRTAKSSICSIMFCPWVWIQNPSKKFLYASYDLKLSMRDSRKARTLIGSDWYQRAWGEKYKILTGKQGQDAKQRFDNNKGGHRISTATNAGTTGEGGDCIIYDDPNNVNTMQSEAYIEQVIFFHEHVMSSRLDNAETGARICIQQRSSERDLTGHILGKELGWDHLVIPMEYEDILRKTTLGMYDPRTQHGELLWPERFPESALKQFKANEIMYAGQYQQRPSPGEGGKFKRDAWRFWNPADTATKDIAIRVPGKEPVYRRPVTIPEAFEQVLSSWDLAFKNEKHSDFVAGHVWGRVGANVYLLDRVSDRMDIVQTLKAIKRMTERYPVGEKLIEDKANGPAVISMLRDQIPGIIAVTPDGGKIARANAISPYVSSGNVYLPNPDLYPWVWELIEQFANFPRGRHDDDVDAASQALTHLFDSASNSALPEFRVAPRNGEVSTACHVEHIDSILIAPHWKRWIAISPGARGAAVWFCETPSGAVRVYRELDISSMDAFNVGRAIAEYTLPDIRAFMRSVSDSARWNIRVFLEKEAFVPIEPIGSYAALMEDGILQYEPTDGDWDYRQRVKQELKMASFTTDVSNIEEGTFDRLRDLLRFKPPDFEEIEYDRTKAFAIAQKDVNAYNEYMAAVEGRVLGEYPKIKFASECEQTVATLGSTRKSEDITDPFMRALLIGISHPNDKPASFNKNQGQIQRAPMRPADIRSRLAKMAMGR